MSLPLLLAFAEDLPMDGTASSSHLGTETFTKAIEESDSDALAAPGCTMMRNGNAGTATFTASSEEQDVDLPSPPDMVRGTETFTEVGGEESDSDEPRLGAGLWEAVVL